jgi:hypothetical protein
LSSKLRLKSQFGVTVVVTTIGIVDVPEVGQRGGGEAEVTGNAEVNFLVVVAPRRPMFQ